MLKEDAVSQILTDTDFIEDPEEREAGIGPLIDEAITIDYRPREGDDIHAVFAPQVVPDVCPGCGLCEQRCPVSDPAPAIVVVPAGAQEETYVARRNGAA